MNYKEQIDKFCVRLLTQNGQKTKLGCSIPNDILKLCCYETYISIVYNKKECYRMYYCVHNGRRVCGTANVVGNLCSEMRCDNDIASEICKILNCVNWVEY